MNVLLISTAADAPHNRSKTSHIMRRPKQNADNAISRGGERGLHFEFTQVNQVKSQSDLNSEI